MTGPNVKVFTAGDHFAGMTNPAESKELLEALLNRAGYTKGYDWECRIDKQKHCSGESRPVRVIGYKSYGVILRVKPHTYSTIDYQMTLHIPQGSGYSAKNLFDQLKSNEKSISRIIRQQEHKEKKEPIMEVVVNNIPPAPSPYVKPAPVVVQEEVESSSEYRPEFKNLQAVLKNVDKLRYILQKVKLVNGFDFCRNKLQFVETLKHECKWDKEGHSKGAVGRVLTELVKVDYLMETVNDRNRIIGYSLTQKALSFITSHKDDKPLPVPPAPPKKETHIDIANTLINMRDKLQELADVANKITANNAEREELLRKAVSLEKENEELTQIMGHNKECQEILNKLGLLIAPLPIQGIRHTDQ